MSDDESGPQPSPDICLAVLNPEGRDPFIDYAKGPGSFQPGVHPPINYHAYAAATRGAFFDSTEAVIQNRDRFEAVLVLIRKRCWISLRAVQALKQVGEIVLVAWKESGPAQISRQLRPARSRAAFDEILKQADGVLSPTLTLPPDGNTGASSPPVRFIPTPYPLEYPEWNFSIPMEERNGILIGTREFFQPERHHREALEIAAEISGVHNIPVTVINGDKWRGRRKLQKIETSFSKANLRILNRLLYDDYLKLVAAHRLIFQRDRSAVPGQVAGDCLLGRTLCLGGDSAIEQVAFPEFAETGPDALVELFTDDHAYEAAIRKSQEMARQKVSFTAGAKALADFLKEISSA